MTGPADPIISPAHPLANRLIDTLARPGARVLEIGTGSGRNLIALMRADFNVTSVDENAERVSRLTSQFPELKKSLLCVAYTQLPKSGNGYDAVLSTHGLLHGDVSRIRAVLAEMHRVLRAEGRAYFTLGSSADARVGQGRRLGAVTFAPVSGDEQGVPHSYFDQSGVHGLLGDFQIEELHQSAVDDLAGSWAHETTPLSGAVHWFTVVKKPR
ncbi:MAG: class I SAM-dependent methyltransferase [Candidatus Eremiobacteraeota bacterium]|nr:class I SAM-dependent methyltransferase [Candidatus Eremiobacteraeota bacterium]